MEDLAEKDATEKSDAVRDALLAELDLDSKKASKGGNDNTRQTQDKAKDKKKSKESRKSKDFKVYFYIYFSKPAFVYVMSLFAYMGVNTHHAKSSNSLLLKKIPS